jgi:hypothetical protein
VKQAEEGSLGKRILRVIPGWFADNHFYSQVYGTRRKSGGNNHSLKILGKTPGWEGEGMFYGKVWKARRQKTIASPGSIFANTCTYYQVSSYKLLITFSVIRVISA